VSVAPGADVSFALTVTASTTRRVDLTLSGVPEGWTATLRGGGLVVDGVLATTSAPPEVTLDIQVPAEAAANTYRMTVTASGGGETATLPLDVRVAESAAGDVSLATDIPQKRGPADATFDFSLTLSNDTAADLTFDAVANGPEGWNVTTELTGQEQAASAVVKAGSTATINVSADPPDEVAAQAYPIAVVATAGGRTAEAELQVEITGSNKLTLTTPNDQLATRGSVGSDITQQLVVKNEGTAPLENVTVTATAPRDWDVTFDTPTVAAIPPGSEQTVTATVRSASAAITSDYMITFQAAAGSITSSQNIRITLEASLLWAAVGLLLIAAVLIGLFWVFRTYGRR
jgi:uncharacterized membrane protein